MPGTRRTPLQRHGLSYRERMALEWNDDGYYYYPSQEERRAAWERHRDLLLAESDRGWRPQAWWDFDAPGLRIRPPRDPAYVPAGLWEAGALAPEEAAQLEKGWREGIRSLPCTRLVWALHRPRQEKRHVRHMAQR